jgi:type VI protein secretion system component Hcp
MELLFMRLEGIEGEEPIGDSEKLIKIESYSHSLGTPTAPFRPSVGEDAALRRPYCQHGLFTVTKGFDITSSRLFEACANGVVFPTVAIFLCVHREAGLTKDLEMKPLLTIVLEDAVMASFDYGFQGGWPAESIGFRYTSIGWEVDWIDPATGEDKKLDPVGWDGMENVPAAVSPGSVKWGSGKSLLGL